MAALLAFASSIVWGTGDFFGGLLSRRRSAIAVVLAMQTFGLLFIAAFATATGGWSLQGNLVPGIAAGVAGTVGLMAFYRALALGTMGVVAPIAALGVVLPLVYGLVLGDLPSPLQWAGILAAIIGVMAASGPELSGGTAGKALALALLAAAMFGSAMALMAAGATDSAVMTVALMRVVQVAIAIGFWVRWRGFGGVSRGDLPLLALVGLCDVSANLMYSVAAAMGPVSIVAVLGSLPPVATAVLGRFVLKERLVGVQYVGVVLALAGVVAISAG